MYLKYLVVDDFLTEDECNKFIEMFDDDKSIIEKYLHRNVHIGYEKKVHGDDVLLFDESECKAGQCKDVILLDDSMIGDRIASVIKKFYSRNINSYELSLEKTPKSFTELNTHKIKKDMVDINTELGLNTNYTFGSLIFLNCHTSDMAHSKHMLFADSNKYTKGRTTLMARAGRLVLFQMKDVYNLNSEFKSDRFFLHGIWDIDKKKNN